MKYLIFAFCMAATITTDAQTYWQQHVATKIDVRLDDKNHFLHAYEEMVYTNNSHDTLKSLYLHIWPNAYKNDRTPFAEQEDRNGNTDFYYSKAKDRGYIDSLDFSVDGHSVEHFIAENTPDITRIDLAMPLLPGHKIKITTPFRVKIPVVFSRLGHTGQAYYISQWFPKPAVYDAKGWHAISYLDQGEFYSEYGTYDVSITLPKNYIVMATGNCLDESENKWLDSLALLPNTRQTRALDTNITSSTEMKTIHFHEDNVHDFAWFTDKRWIVRKDTVRSPGTDNLVTAWAAYMPSYENTTYSNSWTKATGYLTYTVKSYGKLVGPYPYKTIKAVLGDMKAGGGMEYPTVTVITKGVSLKKTIVHEAGHNWFYGMLGSNERDHAWMDEGLNTFYEKRTAKGMAGEGSKLDRAVGLSFGIDEELLYYHRATTNTDQPIEQTSVDFTKINYGLDVYYKTWLMMSMLEQYMGADNFEQGMHDYYDAWHFKHPQPENFRACIQKNTTKSLDWFFDGIMNTTKRIDFTITDATVNGNNTEVTIRNNSGLLCPVMINAYKDTELVPKAKGWAEPFTNTTTITLPTADWTKIIISNVIPDAKTANNTYYRNGTHRFALKLNPMIGLNRSDKYKVFIGPAIRYNQYDGFMAGAIIHNLTIPENRFRFALIPMYAFQANSFIGAGSIGYIWYPNHVFNDILLQVDGKSFHSNETQVNLSKPLYARYLKIAPSLSFTLKEPTALSTVTRTLTLKDYNIMEEGYAYVPETKIVSQTNMYGLIRYNHANTRTFNPFRYTLEGQMGADFAKVSIEGSARIDYNTKKKSLYVRGYLGKFFAISNDPAAYDRYKLNAGYSGMNDYLYDGTYFGRNATTKLNAQQISLQEGGFKVPVFSSVNRSDNWLGAVNLETDLPLGKWPVKAFLDVGMIPNFTPTISNNRSTTLLYDAGLSVRMVKDVMTIYVPIIMSNDFQNYLKNTYGKNSFTHGISFTFQLQNINWLRAPSGLLKMAVGN